MMLVCIVEKKQINLGELITFGLVFLIRVRFFETLKSGN